MSSLQRLSLLLLTISPLHTSILVRAFATTNNNTPKHPADTAVVVVEPLYEGITRIRGRVAYDGNGFKGFQLQPKRRTIQGDLEAVLSQRFQRLVRVVGASRTDAGVHARAQAVHFDLRTEDSINLEEEEDLQKLQFSMNSMLKQDVRVYNLEKAPESVREIKGKPMLVPWNAIHESTGKLYIYRLCAAKHMDPLERHTRHSLKWKDPIDVDVLTRTLKHMEGYHDFRAFAGGIEQLEKHLKGKTMNTKRTVYSIEVVDEGEDMYRIEVRLKGALYKMVRNMVGSALEVAWGKLPEEEFLALLHRTEAAGRKQNRSKPAPPEGLTLESVYYDDY
eukprot:CAMPEP_0119009804 /NCGR_PEP_ID=MMETSP1176-20130426/4613_1 /TAXON_ID=265551 /ORGANISM="Synedropsis recta cf, Strain CCMP1620" /LENGTH=333 /DNA_ID=CAMNT_0006962381 /DNA_START=1054 /DNA_END=2055 /DNA_ORIENTATION=-